MKVLLSIKPEYAEKILDGEKKYEFRRTVFRDTSIKKVVIYASSPIKRVIGEFEIDSIIALGIDALWKKTMHCAGIEKDFYYNYFYGKKIGYAIKVKKTRRYRKHIGLNELNVKYPPQSFLYLTA
ncbi:MAG: hypothetical protein HQL10_12390 [Nitrospirae bacterium]|nr:hypothetical protein [Nitrospirota bacterium]